MKTERIHGTSEGFLIGMLTSLLLIGYFLLMRFAGLIHITELRLFNFFILFAGTFWAMKRSSRFSNGTNDLSPLGTGCLTVVTAVSIFTAFLYLYLVSDSEAMNDICRHSSIGSFLNPETAAIGVLAEGMSSGIIMAYVFLAFSKRST